MSQKTVAIIVCGRVQGVGYRIWTRDEAIRRGLTGQVGNLADVSVEAVFQGPEADVDAMIEACRAGPPGARVSEIRFAAHAATGPFRGFAIVRG